MINEEQRELLKYIEDVNIKPFLDKPIKLVDEGKILIIENHFGYWTIVDGGNK